MVSFCPGCGKMAAVALREVADVLAMAAGAELGMLIGGPSGALVGRAIGPEVIESGALAIGRAVKKKPKRSKPQTKRARTMSRAMKTTNGKARKKDGSFKKGWSQSRIMKEAHKECHRRMRK